MSSLADKLKALMTQDLLEDTDSEDDDEDSRESLQNLKIEAKRAKTLAKELKKEREKNSNDYKANLIATENKIAMSTSSGSTHVDLETLLDLEFYSLMVKYGCITQSQIEAEKRILRNKNI